MYRIKWRTVLTLTAAVCQLDIDSGSCLDCVFVAITLGKVDVRVKLTDIIWLESVSACLSDCCSQLWIMSRLFSTSGDGRTPELAADTVTLALFDLVFVKPPSSGCSRANSVTETPSVLEMQSQLITNTQCIKIPAVVCNPKNPHLPTPQMCTTSHALQRGNMNPTAIQNEKQLQLHISSTVIYSLGHGLHKLPALLSFLCSMGM